MHYSVRIMSDTAYVTFLVRDPAFGSRRPLAAARSRGHTLDPEAVSVIHTYPAYRIAAPPTIPEILSLVSLARFPARECYTVTRFRVSASLSVEWMRVTIGER